MKKTLFTLLLLVLVPAISNAQADQKLINKAQQGDTKAMVLLGRCYENGAGVEVDSSLALKWYQRAAEQGDGEGWLNLSRYYIRGTLLPHDTARHFAIRKEWADKELPNGLAALSNCYLQGYGCPVDSAKALELLQQSVAKGSAWGYEQIGNAHMDGILGLPKDSKKAVNYWEKAYKAGSYDLAGRIATYYMYSKNYKKALQWVEKGEQWGNADAVTVRATMMAIGWGMPMDEAKAQQIMSDLIAKHHNLNYSQAYAGILYMYADSAALRDSAKAMRIWLDGTHFAPGLNNECLRVIATYYAENGQWEQAYPYFLAAASKQPSEGGSGLACRYLALMTQNGLGCLADEEASLQWLHRGADVMHNPQCALALAAYYEDQSHQDLTQAVKYYRMADHEGDTSAMMYLGNLYASSGNADMAIECFDRMITAGTVDGYYYKAMLYEDMGDTETCNRILALGHKKGCAPCTAALGTIYENGLDGHKVDYKKSAKYYQQAGIPFAYYRLSRLYLDQKIGKGSDKDIAKGLDYLNTASALGHIDAIDFLGHCYAYGWYVDTIDHEKAIQCFQELANNDVPQGNMMMALYYEHNQLASPTLPADTAKAVQLMGRAADQGLARAKCYLGDYYRSGHFVTKDPTVAFDLYMQAHQLGEEWGTYYVGRSYLEGCGVPVDSATALPYLRSAADQGIGNAAFLLAEFYNYGLGGVIPDSDTSLAYYLTAHENGSGAASNFIGRTLLQEGEYETAAQYLLVGAQRGDIDATVAFATCLQNGLGVEPSPRQAYQLFEKAVRENRHPSAYGALGLACLQGNGCPEDDNLGKAYLDTAVALGNDASLFYLGICHLQGLGCHPDTAAAISCLEKAADNQHIRAINALGDIYRQQSEFKNAVLYYEKGVAMGSLESYCNLGYCYQEGLGVVLNSQKAYELYRFAAEHDYTRACRMVATCYMNGIYVEPDMKEALLWLTKAADSGDPTSMYYCGSILEEGAEGVPADKKKALQWYKKAAAQGYEPAEAALSRLTAR